MVTRNLTADAFEEAVDGNELVVVDFWATWCGPCRSFGTVFETASNTHEDVVFGKVDIDENPVLAEEAEIRSIPTLMAFKEGVLVYRQSGALPSPDLDDLIVRLRELDMDHVRSHLSHAQDE